METVEQFLAREKATRRADTRKVYLGYTQAQMEDAFEFVKPKNGWKNPIKAVVDSANPKIDINAILASIDYFCGGGGFSIPVEGSTKVKICAPGYYSIIGG